MGRNYARNLLHTPEAQALRTHSWILEAPATTASSCQKRFRILNLAMLLADSVALASCSTLRPCLCDKMITFDRHDDEHY